MNFENFLNLSNEDVSSLIKERGTKIIGIPFNGTRRWLFLEHIAATKQNFVKAYLELVGNQIIEILQLIFDHGISTVLTPLFGDDLMKKGSDYLQFVGLGLTWFVKNEKWLEFFRKNEIKVKFYGEYKTYFSKKQYRGILSAFKELEDLTANNCKNKLFIGLFGQDCSERVAQIGIDFFQKNNRIPLKDEIIAEYYGEYLKPLDIFIGFDRPTEFDMPLISDGSEDLYFTVCPTLYLNKNQFRHILYDHLFTRKINDSQYENIPSEEWERLSIFYTENRDSVLGVGTQGRNGHFWYPSTQIKLPRSL